MDEFTVEIPVKIILSNRKKLEQVIITYNFPNDNQIMETYDVKTEADIGKIFTRTESFTQGSNDGMGFSFDSETPYPFLEKKIKLLESLKKNK